jgi:mono/diheme cytochrome c family protein
MPTSSTLTRALPLFAATAAIAVVAAGCGTTNADPARGRALFIQTCGSCHTLAQAATTGTQGPNLDDAFAADRAAGGFDADTISGLVKAQVEFPRPVTSNPVVSMPPKLLEGQDLEDVAAYVGSVAGTGQKAPTVPGGPGAQIFANNGCAGCHTLAAANAGGTVGPNLDKSLAGQSAAMITQSIVNPNAKITPGYPSNVMPQNLQQVIPASQLKQLVDYLVTSTGGKAGASSGKSGASGGGSGAKGKKK